MGVKFTVSLCLAVLFFFINATIAKAVTFTATPSQTSIIDNQSITITAGITISGSQGNDYYIKGVFSSSTTPTSYFGFTKNNSGTWYNGSTYSQFYKITMDSSGTWSGIIEVKPDMSDSSYKGTGDYQLKLRYYTSGGSQGGTDSNISTITITSSSTPTPTATPTSTPTSTPTLTPTATSTPTPTPIHISTPKPTISPTTDSLLENQSDSSDVLSAQDEQTPGPDSTSFSLTSATSSTSPSFSEKIGQVPPLAFVFVFLGIFFLSFAGYSFFRQKAKEVNTTEVIDFKNDEL